METYTREQLDKFLADAKAYVEANLKELCKEYLELHDGKANAGDRIIHLRRLCHYAGYAAGPMAEGLVTSAAMRHIVGS